jgi:hypothetical protein
VAGVLDRCVGRLDEALLLGVADTTDTVVLTPFQKVILKALDGKALTLIRLEAATGLDRARLFRPNALKGLRLPMLDLVRSQRGVGYYRPDAPPPDTVLAPPTGR